MNIEYIENIISQLGTTKADIAKKMEMSKQSLNALLKSDNPTLQKIKALSNALDVPVSTLLDDEVAAHQDNELCAFVRFRSSGKDVHLYADTWEQFWRIVDEIASSHPRPRKQP